MSVLCSLKITVMTFWRKRNSLIVKWQIQTCLPPTIYPQNLLTQVGSCLNTGSMHFQINSLIRAAVEWWTKPISCVSTASPLRLQRNTEKVTSHKVIVSCGAARCTYWGGLQHIWLIELDSGKHWSALSVLALIHAEIPLIFNHVQLPFEPMLALLLIQMFEETTRFVVIKTCSKRLPRLAFFQKRPASVLKVNKCKSLHLRLFLWAPEAGQWGVSWWVW